MEFEWDAAKAEANVARHGVDFPRAAGIFSGRVLRNRDVRRDYGEDRFVAIGESGGDVLVVVYTLRHDLCRVISARRANRAERRAYEEATTRPA